MNPEEFTKPNREAQNKNRGIDKNELIALFEQYREQEQVMVKQCQKKRRKLQEYWGKAPVISNSNELDQTRSYLAGFNRRT